MDNKFVLSQSFNDIVFEKRHKKYGAYQIRRTYTRYALVAVSAAVLFFTCGSLTWAYVANGEDADRYRSVVIDMGDGIPTIDTEQPKEDEPKEPEPVVETSVADLGPKTPDLTTDIEVVLEDVTPPPGNLEAGKDPLGVTGGIGTGTPVKDPCPGCIPKDSVEVLPPAGPVDWSPFPPTNEGLDAYLTKNIRYPNICRENGIEGTVYMEFIVDTKGNYREVHVVKGAHPAMNAEALRVMQNMPAWTPAKDDKGRLVEFIMRKPIKFQLN
ncbi:MAG TPA: TonB family protein [Bacteroidia bacterium]|nr:TonB family protein [Bacteroidia bacterium]